MKVLKKTSLAFIALACLVALSLVYGLATITVCHADNPRPYSPDPIEPRDNPKPYDVNPIFKLRDNPRPY